MHCTMQGASNKNTSWLKARAMNMNFDLSKSEYRAIENIGTGAYGVVCSAVQVRTGKKFAIKKIPNAFGDDTTAKRTFRELKILRHFDHENVIRIHEILMPREPLSEFRDVYVVMDLMESDLHQILHSDQPFTDEHTQYFLYQILRGLKYIHSANVVHRDLKPSNLLVNQNCELKIGDFGMARGMSSKVDTQKKLFMTQYVATRWYRAPELLFSSYDYKQSVDMWSVGCIFAEMITRKQLFPGKNPVDQLSLIINVLGLPPDSMLKSAGSKQIETFFRKQFGGRTPISLEKRVPDASPGALLLLSRMLIFDPDSRISIEDSLRDPFVESYHDPDDEPICLPKFDFSFDDQPMVKEQIRQQVGKMILKYSRQKMGALKFPTSGIALPPRGAGSLVPAGKLTPVSDHSVENKPQNVASPDEGTSVDGPIEVNKATNSLGNKLSSPLKPLNPVSPPLLQADRDSDPSVAASSQVTTDVEMKSARSACNDAVKSILSITAKTQTESKDRTDVEMRSAKKAGGGLEVPGDVNMLSAKAERTEATGGMLPCGVSEKGDAKLPLQGEKRALGNMERTEDTKALIKAALKQTVLMKNKLKKENPDKHEQRSPVRKMSLALSRQKEREEKRRQRHKRAKDKQKGKKAKTEDKGGLLLTDEDRVLLEKWKGMQVKQDTGGNQPQKEGAVVPSSRNPPSTSGVQSQAPPGTTSIGLNSVITAGGQGTSQPVIFTVGDSPIFTTNSQSLILLPVNPLPGHMTTEGSLLPSQNVGISVLGGAGAGNLQRTVVTQGAPRPLLEPVNPPPPALHAENSAALGGSSNFSDITSLLLDSPDQQQGPFTNDVFLGSGSEPAPTGDHGNYRTDVFKNTPSPPSFLPAPQNERPQQRGGPVRDAATPPDMNAISDQLARAAVLEDPLPFLQLTPRGDMSGYGLGVNLEEFLSCDVTDTSSQNDSDSSSKSAAEGQLSASVLSGILREHDLDPDDLQAIHQELGLTSPITLENLSQLSPTTVVATP